MSINVIGIGLDGVVGLNESVRKIVERATVLVGSDRHLRYFPNHSAEIIVLEDILETIVEIRQHLDTPNSCIVVLTSGDPLFFGLGRLLVTHFPPEKLRFYPHLSSVQLAFSRLKIPWQDAKIISVHGRSMDELIQALQQGIEKIAVLTDNTHTPKAIASLLLALDLPIDYHFWVCENIGSEDERVQQWSIDEAQQEIFAPLNIVVLLRQSKIASQSIDLANLPWLGIPDNYFFTYDDRPGLMTKREVRVLILAELGLQPGQIIWDIGAGSGSVSVEIARLFSDSTVYAIEKTAAGTSLIEENCRRFQTNNVVSIHGNAPDILHHLRPPHRIFIGGSSGKLRNILGVCGMRMLPGGIIVLAFTSLENLHTALSWVEERKKSDRSWNYRLLQVQLSRSIPIANLTRFTPLNPVNIMIISRQ
ncbi:precorrin-6y C5,15-methyltransferase (decarboxylating) subunit CbiE [Okeania sp. SIO2B3]|uniref:precorrin-6y C5,15-methyltransferase (decarboxylating) subunit CbiE n=1 Tax=Okeania sp. SIO2B3 TaxID=2607784 RepID=UPI0013C16962|nr:precorrin-6y C5,15-methyltransferase (decarboxylating) subunit CbiE [Okeania sp. SIO2B3]NET46244.1 precorrin-6y C5,15-methyltransferase (decarboxylating) subunit CbiE [Okeania sp. SIO2B3]